MNNCSDLDEKISYICNCEYGYFFNKPNVVGIGLGYKRTNTFNTFNKCIKVFVSKKIDMNRLDMYEAIPKCYKSIPTDVEESGILIAQKLNTRIRPAPGGYSVGSVYETGGGTMGCLVRDDWDNTYILSCNHVFTYDNKVALGTEIVQPAICDGGKVPNDVIAVLSNYVPIKFKSTFKRPTNYVDCAIGKVGDRYRVSSQIALVGQLRGIHSINLNDNVKKVGATTEVTYGKVLALYVTNEVNLFGKKAIFKEQIITSKMSEAGDSGAILLNNNNNAVGLLMSAGDNFSVFNTISNVLEALEVHLVTG